MSGWNRLFIVFSFIAFVLIMLVAYNSSGIHSSSKILSRLPTPLEVSKTGEFIKSGEDSWVMRTRYAVEDHELKLILKRAGFTEYMLRSSFQSGKGRWLITEEHYEKVRNASKMYFIERFFKKDFIIYCLIWGGLVTTVYLIGITCSWVIRGFRT